MTYANLPIFKEGRGNSYFIGEVFAVHRDLIPNSQRDNFNENDMRVYFEKELKHFFKETLHKLYYDASKFRGYCKKVAGYDEAKKEFENNLSSHGFINDDDKLKAEKSLENKRKEATKAQEDIDKFLIKNPPETASAMVAHRIRNFFKPDNIEIDDNIEIGNGKGKRKGGFITSLLPLSKKEQKLVSKIYQIIMDNIGDKDVGRSLIDKIQEGLK